MSLIALQQIIERLDRPLEIKKRVSLLKPFNTLESKKAMQMCAGVLSRLPVDVGLCIFSILDAKHQTKWHHQWVNEIFKNLDHLDGHEVAQRLVKAGDIVTRTNIPLPPPLFNKIAKKIGRIVIEKDVFEQAWTMFSCVMKRVLEINIEYLKRLGNKRQDSLFAINRRAHNITQVFECADNKTVDQIDHVLNWTGISSCHSDKIDALRSAMQHHNLSTELKNATPPPNAKRKI